MPHKQRCFILIIQIRPDLTLCLIWLLPRPHQNIGGGFFAPVLDTEATLIIPLLRKTPQRKNSLGNPFNLQFSKTLTRFHLRTWRIFKVAHYHI